MTWGNRVKLFLGLLLTLAIVAAATIVFNQRQTHVTSTSAQIGADLYRVGTDYGGIVTESYVRQGDRVTEGQKLFTVRSLQLERDIAIGAVSPNEAIATSDGTVIIRASTTGTLSEAAVDEGTYASAGSVIATIDAEGSLYAEAEFVLTPRDFGRVENQAEVTLLLPDGREMKGNVTEVTVRTENGQAHVTARVESEALADAIDDPLLKLGTPVDATLKLSADGPLAGLHDALSDFARKIGL